MASLHTLCTLLALVSVLTVHTVSARGPVWDNCTRINACSCYTDSGSVIDLSPLDSWDYLRPAFYDVSIKGLSKDKFSWNPCTPFCQSLCENAAVCQHQTHIDDFYFNAGVHSTARFSLNYRDDNIDIPGLSIIYTKVSGPMIRQSIIRLLCDENSLQDRLIPFGESSDGSDVFLFDLVSRFACPRNIPVPPSDSDPVVVTCPRPWLSTTTAKTTAIRTTSSEKHPSTASADVNPIFPTGRIMWIAIITISVLVFFIIVMVIVMIVSLCSRAPPRTAIPPSYNKVEMSQTKVPIRY